MAGGSKNKIGKLPMYVSAHRLKEVEEMPFIKITAGYTLSVIRLGSSADQPILGENN